MSGHGLAAVTDADVRSLAARLKGLHAHLTPGEQTLLHAALRRAAGREASALPDVEGFAWAVGFDPLAFLDAITVATRGEEPARGD